MHISSLFLSPHLIILSQPLQRSLTDNHKQQANDRQNQQRKREPPQHHSSGPDATAHAPVAKVLRHLRGRDRRRVLPQHGDEDEDGGEEDQGQRRLRDRAVGKGLDVDV